MDETSGKHPGLATLEEQGLTYPEAWLDYPWGEVALKVRKKVFAFLWGDDEGAITFTAKLPESSEDALALPNVTRTGYGLGKHGWVTYRLARGADVPMDMLFAWMDESYRAVAPKTLVKQLPPVADGG